MFQFELSHPSFGNKLLENDPLGWEDISLKYSRDRKYHGLSLEIGLDLEFVLDGMELIKQVYAAEKIRGKIGIQIYEHNTETFEYELFYTGQLSLKAYSAYQKNDAPVVKVNIVPANAVQAYLNQDDVLVNLQKLESLNGSAIPRFRKETESVELHSRVMVQAYEAMVQDQAQAQTWSYETTPEQRTPFIYFGFDEIKQNDLGFFTLGSGYSFDDNLLEIWTSPVKGRLTIDFDLKTRLYVEAIKGDYDKIKVSYFFRIQRANGGIEEHELASDEKGSIKRTYSNEVNTGPKQFSTDIQIGDKLYLYGDMLVTEVSGPYRLDYRLNILNGSYFKAICYTQTNATYASGVLLHEAFGRVCQSITNQPFAFYSEYFGRVDSDPVQYAVDGEGSLAYITNGFQLRGFPLADKPIFTNLSTLYDGSDAIHNLGAGVERIFGVDVLRVEPKGYFYQPEVVMHLGQVTDLKISSAIETYYSGAEIGYQQWRGSDSQGLEEFNSKRSYVLDFPELKNVYQASSKFITSGFNIETVRRDRYVAESKKDDNRDDSLFLICLHRGNGSFVTERDQNLSQSQNLFSPETIYNLRVSPARNAQRHASVFTAGLKSTEKARFNFGEGNYTVSSRLNNELAPVVENQDVPATKSLWGNDYYEFEWPINPLFRQMIKTKPYGCYSFNDCEGNIFYGHILDVDTKLKDGVGSFKLIQKG